MEKKDSIKSALTQIPELVQLTKSLLQNTDRKFAILADQAQKPQAEVSEKSKEKLLEDVRNAIVATRCATPDMSDVAKAISELVVKNIRETIHESSCQAVKEAVKDTPVKVEHFHSHTSIYSMTQMAEKKLKRMVYTSLAACATLFVGLAVGLYCHLNSVEHLAREYADVYFSEYTTKEEAEMLSKNTFTIAFLPKELAKNARLTRTKLSRNKAILKEREKEAKAHDGKFSTKVPLER